MNIDAGLFSYYGGCNDKTDRQEDKRDTNERLPLRIAGVTMVVAGGVVGGLAPGVLGAVAVAITS